MSEAYVSVDFRACMAVAAELRAAAVDASSDLPMMERRALATLATAVEARLGGALASRSTEYRPRLQWPKP